MRRQQDPLLRARVARITPASFARRMPAHLRARFVPKVDFSGDCWVWTGSLNDGYGSASVRGPGSHWKERWRSGSAHKIAWEVVVAKVPAGYHVDHLCRNRACVRPSHLEPVTARENILRGNGMGARAARRSTCAKGHPLSGDNLRLRMRRGRLTRSCRTCGRENARRHHQRTKVLGPPKPYWLRRRPAPKTHCRRGHPLRGPSADVYVNKKTGWVRCAPCVRWANEWSATHRRSLSLGFPPEYTIHRDGSYTVRFKVR